ncbi:MAG: TIGR01777 family protein [Actinomycetota bacterium]|nr:MAG: TIGR01777 family protein [Actinomycetota bacterium]
MKVVISGASGLIGSALVASLAADGHEVVRLVRRTPAAPDEARWDPAGGTVDSAALRDCDAVVHLAGAGVGDHRWTPAYRQEIRASRVDGTTTLATAVAQLDRPPQVFVSASAIGVYGDTGSRTVDETAPAADGFLPEVVQAWEAAADPARAAGIRTVHPRSGLVLSRHGGALGRMLPIARLGLLGPLGGGRQYWSYISRRDEVAALRFLIDTPGLAGPVNLTAPHPATNAEVTRALGALLRRPAVLPVPAFALRVVLGGFSDEVLGSRRVVPDRLERSGFQWSDGSLEQALASGIGEN